MPTLHTKLIVKQLMLIFSGIFKCNLIEPLGNDLIE